MRYQILITTISVMTMVLIVCMQCSEGLDVCKVHDTDKLVSQLGILQSSIPLGPDRSTCLDSGACNKPAPGPPFSRTCEEIYKCSPQDTH